MQSTPCFEDRKTTEKLEDIEVICMSMGDRILLKTSDNTKRYSVCNVDEFELEENKKYMVSGVCYEIKANERWPGTPFQLTKVKNLE